MITCIISSIDPCRSRKLAENIRQTAAVAIEIIIHDNRVANWGLCKVYNYYSERAAYDVICYLHEDILFRTERWAEKIVRFYRTNPQAGVVGFLGSQLKTHSPSAVGGIFRYEMGSLLQHSASGIKVYAQRSGTDDFSPVIQIDGLCMFVRKAVWATHRFDEVRFDGFHLYDLDFCIHVAQHCRNYVCHNVLVEHLSEGSHNEAWFRYTVAFQRKWGALLPMMSVPLPLPEIQRAEAYNAYKFYKKVLKAKHSEHLQFARTFYLPLRSLSSRLRLARYYLKYHLS